MHLAVCCGVLLMKRLIMCCLLCSSAKLMSAFGLLLQFTAAGGACQSQLPRASSYSSGASDLGPAELQLSFDEAPGSPGSAGSQPYGSRGSTGSQPSREGTSQTQERDADATGAGCTAGGHLRSGGQPGTGADWEENHWQQLTEASHSFSGGKNAQSGLDKRAPVHAPAPCGAASAVSSTNGPVAGTAEEPYQRQTAAHIGCWSSIAVQPHTIAEHQQSGERQQGGGSGDPSSTTQTHSEPSQHSSSVASARQADRQHNRLQGDSVHAQLDFAAKGPPAASQLKQPVIWQGQEVASQGMSNAAGRQSLRSPCCNAEPSTAAGEPSAGPQGQAAGATGSAADLAGSSKGQPVLLEPAGGRQLHSQQGLQRRGDARGGLSAGDQAGRSAPAQDTERPVGERSSEFWLCRELHLDLLLSVIAAEVSGSHVFVRARRHCRVPLAAVHL